MLSFTCVNLKQALSENEIDREDGFAKIATT